MSVRRAAALVVLALLSLGAVQLSGATFTASSSSFGSIGAAADLTPPTVSVDASAAVVSGTTQLSATASDREGSVASVRIEVRPVGSTTWTVLCTDTTAPYACAWSTTGGPDGAYDVRAVAADLQGNVGTSPVVQRTVDNLGPVVAVDEEALPEYLRGTVTIPVSASDAGSGVVSVRVQTSTNGTSWSDLCTDTTAPYSCTLVTSTSGDLFLRAVAVDGVGLTTTSAVALVTLDNTPPSVTTQLPGGTLSGTVTISASATDADSGIAGVAIDYRSSSTAPWVALCTDAVSPYSCRFDTTQVPDGTTYAFRSTATDLAGNTAAHVSGTATVDNRVASVSVEDPGLYLRGTVTLNANANAPTGVQSVAIQYAPTGTSTWTTVCTDTTSPYSCSWDTTRVAGGTYDLRAVLTQGNGTVLVSALVTGRIVDNAPLRGVDVQATNGGTLGNVDAGDVLTLTYDNQVSLPSLVAGWDGTARTVGVRLRDGASVTGGVGGEDLLDVFTSTAVSTPVNLGTVNTRANHVKGRDMVFAATMTAQTVTVNGQAATRITVRLDSLTTADSSRLARKGRTMTWTPSSAARTPAGSSSSTAPVEETGAVDRDF